MRFRRIRFLVLGKLGQDDVDRSPDASAASRLPWLIVCLLNGIIAGGVVTYFEETIEAVVTLTVFMPMLAGMGGNTGTQSFAVIVRSIALDQVRARHVLRYLTRELAVGIRLGVTTGLLVGGIAWVWKTNPWIALIVALSMILTLSLATVIGAFVPLGFKVLGIDPALASGPLITTVIDVIGLLIYLGLATLGLQWITP